MASTKKRPRRDAAERGSAPPIGELMAELFRALSHPARLRILETLALGEQSVGELQPRIGIELSHLSQQLRVLRRAALVGSHRNGQLVIYSIKDPLCSELLLAAKRLLIRSLSETRDLLADLHS